MFELLAGIEISSFLFAITCILLIIVFAFMIIFFITYNRNMSIQRKMKKMSDEHQQHIMTSNLQTLETERQRFAEDLHDEIGAALSAIRLYVGSIDTQLEDEHIKAQLREVKHTIDLSMASTRRIAHNILPPGLEIMGLSGVVNDLVKQLNVAQTLAVKISVVPQMPKLDYQRELILYRVLQELFNNTLKHASAKEVCISFKVVNSTYELTYTDDGIGFDASGKQYVGIGLSNVTNRIKMIGGTCLFISAPAPGFEAVIRVPLQLGEG